MSLAVSGTLRRTKHDPRPFRLYALLGPVPGDYIVSGGGDGAVLLFDRRTAKVGDLGEFLLLISFPL